MRIIITGGAGFVGSHLVDELIKRGMEVLVIDDMSNGYEENKNPKAQYIRCDIQFAVGAIAHFKPDLAYHLCCYPRSISFQNPIRDAEVNYLSTLRLCELAKEQKFRIVYSSNSGLMGEPKQLPMVEDQPIHTTTPYDCHKLASEHALQLYSETYGIGSLVFRFGTIYGPRQRMNPKLGWTPLIPDYITRLMANQEVYVYGGATATRDFIFVSDIVRALLVALDKPLDGFVGPILLGTGKETSVGYVQQFLRNHIPSKSQTVHRPRMVGEIDRMCLSTERATRLLGWKPTVPLEEGLLATKEWWTQQ